MRIARGQFARQALLTACLSASLIAARADDGPVSVTFVNPDQFFDIGEVGFDRTDNLKAVEAAIEQLATPMLTPGQTLHIDVLDVDLAGTVRYTLPRRSLRVVTGLADWPRMTLRYRLEDGGRVVRSGEDRLADMSFLDHIVRASERDDPLRREKRMLEDWLKSRFGAARAGEG